MSGEASAQASAAVKQTPAIVARPVAAAAAPAAATAVKARVALPEVEVSGRSEVAPEEETPAWLRQAEKDTKATKGAVPLAAIPSALPMH